MDASLLSMAGFAVAMYITPGPNNLMLASSAATFGLRAAVPHMLGIGIGFTLMLVIVCSGLASLLLAWPIVLPAMRWAGAVWIGLLAWKIATAPPSSAGGGRVMSFGGAMAFQWVNPKGWLIAFSAAGLFARPDQALWMQGLRIGTVFFAVALPCMVPWMLLGAGAGRLLSSPGRLRIFNVAMALLLVASILPVLFD